MSIGIIIQARTKSNRFPRKIYQDINGSYTLQRVLSGAASSKLANKIILAMPKYDEEEFSQRLENGEFINYTDSRFCTYFGDEDDVLNRYFMAARENNLSLVVRITADCPLIQGKVIDEMLCEYLDNKHNGFMSNGIAVATKPYPDGTDVEIFPYWMLFETWQLASDKSEREHVTKFMYRRGTQYSIHSFDNHRPHSIIDISKFPDFSFDTEDDFNLITAICKNYDTHGDLDKAIRETSI